MEDLKDVLVPIPGFFNSGMKLDSDADKAGGSSDQNACWVPELGEVIVKIRGKDLALIRTLFNHLFWPL